MQIQLDDEESILIEEMLNEIESHFEATGRANSFVESLREQFEEDRTLSSRQVTALRNIYDDIY